MSTTPIHSRNPQPYQVTQEDVALLINAGMSAEDLQHSQAVAKKALEIAGRVKAKLDMELIGRGALFHDLGKTQTHAIEHGKIGAEMGQALGLSKAITDIMEKHIRGGLTAAEAAELGLPVKDYTLHKLEERIVIYADRLVDIIHDGIVKIDNEAEAEQRFEDILNTEIKYGKNDITRARYFGYHREIQGLMGNAAQ
ncbi:MAG: HDIG domain-containing protein [Rhodocyclaceae bacterium]|nr:HDIG domain-containing protein [Rhodocyclaceae bacterium]